MSTCLAPVGYGSPLLEITKKLAESGTYLEDSPLTDHHYRVSGCARVSPFVATYPLAIPDTNPPRAPQDQRV